jgi:hypothetical protein
MFETMRAAWPRTARRAATAKACPKKHTASAVGKNLCFETLDDD